jgi:pimeloyl-ACP methyl ester carboxylesterase
MLDWPGHGESPLPTTPLRAVEFGDLLVEFADRLDLSNTVIVGNSVGGYAACRLALERPERVAGLMLVNNGGFTPHTVVTRFFCAVMGRPSVIKAVFPAFVRAYMRAKNPTDEAVVDRAVARAKTDAGARTAAALWSSFTEPGHDLRTRAAAISAPVLITWGAKDVTAPPRWGNAVQAAIPGSRFEALPTGRRRLRVGACGVARGGPAVRRRSARCPCRAPQLRSAFRHVAVAPPVRVPHQERRLNAISRR